LHGLLCISDGKRRISLHIPNRLKKFFGPNIATDEVLSLLVSVRRRLPKGLAQGRALHQGEE
jgi:hypothetical protein